MPRIGLRLLVLSTWPWSTANAMRARGGANVQPSESLMQADQASGFPVGRHLAQLLPVLPAAQHQPGQQRGHAVGAPTAFVRPPPAPVRRAAPELHVKHFVDTQEDFHWPLEGVKADFDEWLLKLRGRFPKKEKTRTPTDIKSHHRGVPLDWLDLLSDRHAHIVYEDEAKTVITAPSAADKNMELAVKILDSSNPGVKSEVQMFKRLQNSGNIVPYFDSWAFPDDTYILTAAADETLFDELVRRRESGEGPMPLSQSVPILIDLLRGVLDLDAKRVVHYALSEEHVLLKGGRPLISGLDSAAILHADGKLEGPEGIYQEDIDDLMFDVKPSLLARLPPETEGGWPTGASNHVWQVGTLFAEMVLGYVPMVEVLMAHDPKLSYIEHWSPTLCDRVQKVIRSHFSIRDERGVKNLKSSDLQELIGGMLDTNVDKRLTAKEALERAIDLAKSEGIDVPPPREPMHMPEAKKDR